MLVLYRLILGKGPPEPSPGPSEPHSGIPGPPPGGPGSPESGLMVLVVALVVLYQESICTVQAESLITKNRPVQYKHSLSLKGGDSGGPPSKHGPLKHGRRYCVGLEYSILPRKGYHVITSKKTNSKRLLL